MKFIQSLILIIIGVGLSMVGDVYLKKSGIDNYKFLGVGILFYAFGAIPVAFAFKKIEFGSVFLIWEALTVVIALIIASVLFKEHFSGYKAAALVFAIAALYLSSK